MTLTVTATIPNRQPIVVLVETDEQADAECQKFFDLGAIAVSVR